MNQLFDWLISIINEFKFWIIVQPWERAVRTRRGLDPVVIEEGMHFRAPLLDQVQILNNRLRTYSFPSHTIETKDRKAVTCAGVVGFRIADPLEAHMTMMEPETVVSALALRCVADFINSRIYDEIAVAEMNEHIATELAAETRGLTIEFVAITEFGAFRTIRLLQENWRPSTGIDKLL